MTTGLSLVIAGPRYIEAMKDLLTSERLPVDDLPADPEHFLIATANGFVIGCVGLEIHGNYGLLRSLAVKPEYRKKKVASQLIQQLESQAVESGLQAIFLLTETAPQYFQKKGYAVILREDVPEIVKQSTEFSHVCPTSAIAMQKIIW